MKAFFCFFFVFLFFSSASAATLEGKVFSWQTLSSLNGAVIDFNSLPKQRIISNDGFYRVSLETGVYQMQAVYYENNVPILYALEEITVRGNGSFVFDLVLFPISDADLNRLALLEGAGKPQPTNFLIFFAVIAVIVLAGAFFLSRKQQAQAKKEKQQDALEEKHAVEEENPEQVVVGTQLDKHALEIVDILKRSGNRLTQKELRERSSVGEAKVSLIVAELEQLGLVKKIKQGRGNIIILKEKA